MEENDEDYFARRAAEERAAADRTTDPKVKLIHLDLAEEYERRRSTPKPGAPGSPESA